MAIKYMTGNEIRTAFVEFFRSKGHTHVPSSSLVPHGDPTLLFTNAGMNQFKDTFLGLEKRPYVRAVTAQKCVRAGGKHNDLDAVGRTARHNTFFEMMGNFSFGDYFKREALAYAWEFITSPDWLGLPTERLWVTIYQDDDEAFEIWHNEVGVPTDRIIRLGEADNFWKMGDTGPCGPCSEIFWDYGEEHACGADPCRIDTCGCDRWREFWNNVFMQFNQGADGSYTPLAQTGVDTGLGLERMATIMQQVWSNYDTDLLLDISRHVERLSGKTYDPGPAGMPFRVIADHARCCTFLIAEGVKFSNEGRGYVMRRILRRAVRFGRSLGFTAPFMHEVVPAVVQLMGEAYPELREQEQAIRDEVRREEERFFRTLEEGMRRLEEILRHMRQDGKSVVSGSDAFLLYDTYGFPLDIVEDVAVENGLTVDNAGYEAAMAEQRARARAARDVTYVAEAMRRVAEQVRDLAQTEFVGYDQLSGTAHVLASFSEDGEPTGGASGDRLIVVLDHTPFYAESGGQTGDAGLITAPGLLLKVEETRKSPTGHWLHFATVEQGFLEVGQEVEAAVDAGRRMEIMRNHTGTHLLHLGLKRVLGEHANQAGSLVAPDRLRFDFSHTGPLTADEIRAVEAFVMAEIGAAHPVETRVLPIEEAKQLGAMMLFGEKYSDLVRVVMAGDSKEFCGGTHVRNTSEVGLFKITSETGVAGGVRRIEAITGQAAVAHMRQQEETIARVASALKCRPEDVAEKAAQLVADMKGLERELEQLRAKLARGEAEELLAGAQTVGGVRVIAAQVNVADGDDLLKLTDLLRDKLGSGVVVLGAASGADKVSLVAAVTKDLAGKVHAGNLIKAVAQMVGGSGGGRPDMARAGGKEPAQLPAAIQAVAGLVGQQLGL